MIEITLNDGAKLNFNEKVTGYDIAFKISPQLAKQAYAVYVNQDLWDLHRDIDFSCKIELITSKNINVLLPLIRHSLAHVMAEAVLELFPDTLLATGPVIENGFFYDFLPHNPFKEEDFIIIEAKMKEIIDRSENVQRTLIGKAEAIAKFASLGEKFKTYILKNNIDEEVVSLYKQGNFEDLCRGPHVFNTNKLPKSFKLTKVSGVYWQGDSNNPMLQRITAVAFLTQKDLDSFLALQEELEKNDHRKIGKDMELFHIQEEAVGSIFWHDKGWKIYRTLEAYIRSKLEKNNYIEVKTPQLLSRSLWEASGHWDKYGEGMFLIEDSDKSTLALKPMNCPGHVQMFKQGSKSYKDLPLRMAEFGCCHRNEPSGSLHGIMRVRAFTQDDAHIFCLEDQIVQETKEFCTLLKEIYKEIFGDIEIIVHFSDRPIKRAGDEEIWDKAEKALYVAAQAAGLDPILSKGEGAFYGPKLEFAIKDSLGRNWQLGTLQVDFILPQRLGATYIAEDGNKYIPVMLHRAILGSFERFIGILLEHYKGRIPLWLSPIHLVIATVSDKVDDYAIKTHQLFQQHNILTILDTRSKKINYKVREHILSKIPIIAVVGEKEATENSLTLRFGNADQHIVLKVDEVLAFIKKNLEEKNICLA
ncbi:Threonine--tRNA ligase [Candidatus Hepatincolaceae symbiont of Richtersius coronifer]